jgi:S-adenosyl-L-methionine hydrolase (adenosine-forming)
MIVLFTDFSVTGPYTGQMKGVLRRHLPVEMPIVNLLADAPRCNPKAAAYLLAASVEPFPVGSVFLCVVDPGVGGARRPCIVEADGRWFVGPDNGLFELVVRRAARQPRWWLITWQPERMSSSFHGRDLFAPVAARLARDQVPSGQECSISERCRSEWPDDLAEVIYVDAFGNAVTGVRASAVPSRAAVNLGGYSLMKATTFVDVPPGRAFWYENASGLIEIAVNRGHAADRFMLRIGSPIAMTVC